MSKTILITGATSGFGRASAKRFAEYLSLGQVQGVVMAGKDGIHGTITVIKHMCQILRP